MESSSLGDMIKRSCEMLKHGASMQVLDYEKRFSSIRNYYDNLLSDLIKKDFSYNEAFKTSEEFFGTSFLRFTGVD